MATVTLKLNDVIKEHERLTKLLFKSISLLRLLSNINCPDINIVLTQLINEYNDQYAELLHYKKPLGGRKPKNKFEYVMQEFKKGQLFDMYGNQIINRKQAIAIALNEQRRYSL